MNLYLLGACLKCRGDLAHDDGDWKCLQCGVYYYTGLYRAAMPQKKGNEGRHRISGPAFSGIQADENPLASAAD